MNTMRNQPEQTQHNQMAMISHDSQRQSGVQVQQTLQTLQQESAVARQELGGRKEWLGGNVSLETWTESTSMDFTEFNRELSKVVSELMTAG